MVWLIESVIAFLISLFVFSFRQALIYALVTLFALTLGKILFALLIGLINGTFGFTKKYLEAGDADGYIKQTKTLEAFSYILFYLTFVGFSYRFNHFLAIPSLMVCLVDYYFKKASDKIMGVQ